ncbi:MAG: caspase family protein [Planctomycetes bacterium]|nr:caspase family protein [Planctomycetota bacterium]
MKSRKLTSLFCLGVIVVFGCGTEENGQDEPQQTDSTGPIATRDQGPATSDQGPTDSSTDPGKTTPNKVDGGTGSNDSGPESGSPMNETPSAPRKLALLVGINDYLAGDVPDLEGCVNDVYDMKQLLRTKFEFAEEDILILTSAKDAEQTTDPKPTHAAIVKAFQQHLIEQADKDAIVVFHYSGHGSLMPDKSGDEIDGKDETIVPYDSRTKDVFDISDDELNGLFGKLAEKTKNITFILDSCHSGSATKGARSRNVDEDLREPPAAFPHARSDEKPEVDARFENQNYVLISGCRANESSYEYYDEKNKQERGALTYFFARVIRESRTAEITYRDVMDKVKGLVTAASTAQHPQLEGGRPTDIDRFIFDVATAVAEPYIIANPRGNSVVLSAGKVQGLTVGSEFDVYAPGTRKFDDATAVARIKLTSVDTYSALGEILADGKQIAKASRAVERVHSYQSNPFPVYFDHAGKTSFFEFVNNEKKLRDDAVADSEALKKIEEFITQDDDLKDSFDVVKSAAKGQIRVSHHKDGMIYIKGGTIESPPVRASDDDAVERVVRQIQHWARWFNVLRLNSPNSKLSADFKIDGPARDAAKTEEGFSKVFKSEDAITISVKNKGTKPFYFAVIDLASDGSITIVYPAEGRTEELAPGKEWSENTEVFVPDDQDSTTDYLKVIAFNQPVDIFFLTTDATPKGGDNNHFPLAVAMGKARGVRPVKTEDWMTDLSVFKVIKD